MAMTHPAPGDDLVRIPMSWEEFLSHDELAPSEYYGGSLVMVPPPSIRHQHVISRLHDLLRAHLPDGLVATFGAGWSPAGVDETLIPDIMVHAPTSEPVLRGTPMLVVEVVSSNRGRDLVAKVGRYAAWGAPTYWIVDPRDRVVLEHRLQDGLFVEVGRHTEGEVTPSYGDGVEVPVDVDALFA